MAERPADNAAPFAEALSRARSVAERNAAGFLVRVHDIEDDLPAYVFGDIRIKPLLAADGGPFADDPWLARWRDRVAEIPVAELWDYFEGWYWNKQRGDTPWVWNCGHYHPLRGQALDCLARQTREQLNGSEHQG